MVMLYYVRKFIRLLITFNFQAMNRRKFLVQSAASTLAMAMMNRTMSVETEAHQTGLVLDESFSLHQLEAGHPESPQRNQAIIKAVEQANLFGQVARVHPTADAETYLTLIHSDEHIEQIRSNDKETYQHALLAVAGVLAATQEVCKGSLQNAFCASRPPGHHALNTGKEEGFCFFNNIAIAARYAQKVFRLKKIAIVDWDYHHGNSTEWAFYEDPNVLFFSVHNFHDYPRTGDPAKKGAGAGLGANINVHLPCGANDEDIIRIFNDTLVSAVDAFEPELILVSCGFDSRKDDLLGCFDVTDAGFIELTKIVMRLADKFSQGKLVSMLEGGYNPEGNANACVAHIKTLLAA